MISSLFLKWTACFQKSELVNTKSLFSTWTALPYTNLRKPAGAAGVPFPLKA